MAKKRKTSRQFSWQQKMASEGKCRSCGKPQGRYKGYCDEHGSRVRARQHETKGCKRTCRGLAEGREPRADSRTRKNCRPVQIWVSPADESNLARIHELDGLRRSRAVSAALRWYRIDLDRRAGE